MKTDAVNALKNIADACNLLVAQAKTQRKNAVTVFLRDNGIEAGQDIMVRGVAYINDEDRREMLGLGPNDPLPELRRGQWVQAKLERIVFDNYGDYVTLCCMARKPNGETYQRGGDFKLKLSEMGDGKFWYVFGTVPRTEFGGTYAEIKAVE